MSKVSAAYPQKIFNQKKLLFNIDFSQLLYIFIAVNKIWLNWTMVHKCISNSFLKPACDTTFNYTIVAISLLLFFDASILVCSKLCKRNKLGSFTACIFIDTCIVISVKQRLQQLYGQRHGKHWRNWKTYAANWTIILYNCYNGCCRADTFIFYIVAICNWICILYYLFKDVQLSGNPVKTVRDHRLSCCDIEPGCIDLCNGFA